MSLRDRLEARSKDEPRGLRKSVVLVVGLRERLDRVPGLIDIGLGDEHLQRRIVERVRVVLAGRLEMGLDPGCEEKLLKLLSLGHVTGDRYLYQPCHV